jgi:hypothetical protein
VIVCSFRVDSTLFALIDDTMAVVVILPQGEITCLTWTYSRFQDAQGQTGERLRFARMALTGLSDNGSAIFAIDGILRVVVAGGCKT